MSALNQSMTSSTADQKQQYQGLLERLLFSFFSTVPCCIFLSINFIILFIIRSKTMFIETSCYILLYNLLFADTIVLIISQLMYLITAFRLRLTYPVCGFLNMLSTLNKEISPLTLAVMSLERYVAVCYPLRHATIITARNTVVAIFMIWALSSLNVLIRIILMLQFPFGELESLQMANLCNMRTIILVPMFELYERVYTCLLIVLTGFAIIYSYVGVMITARSASTNKAFARKTRNTLLLHLIQLGLSLSSTIHNPLIAAIAAVTTKIVFVRVQIIFYLIIIISPRCLSSLIYGIRDQNIRPLLVYHLCCRQKLIRQH